MSDDRFEADWLTLREPADHRARDTDLVESLDAAGRAHGWSRVADLGGGTGSNLRYLSERLDWVDEWEIVDHDADLLREVDAPEEGMLEVVVGDLAREGLAAARRADVVSASALLDIVSRDWLEQLAATVAHRPVGVLFTLSYDGTVDWVEGDADDAFVLDAVNRHQRGEKGLGAALGPEATEVAVELLSAAGLRCEVRESPWRLSGEDDAPLALKLAEGWLNAAREIEPEAEVRLAQWWRSREERIRAGDFELSVGHRDLLALPGR